jgi:hypothetical protein
LALELACFAPILPFKLVLVPELALLLVSQILAWPLNQILATVVVLIVKQLHTVQHLAPFASVDLLPVSWFTSRSSHETRYHGTTINDMTFRTGLMSPCLLLVFLIYGCPIGSDHIHESNHRHCLSPLFSTKSSFRRRCSVFPFCFYTTSSPATYSSFRSSYTEDSSWPRCFGQITVTFCIRLSWHSNGCPCGSSAIPARLTALRLAWMYT